MKNQVIRRNKKVMAILGAYLIAAAIVIALFVIFLQGNDRIIGAFVFGIPWVAFSIAYIYYLTWKISFNDEEFSIRYFFITIKYKRDDVVVKNEKRMVRTRGFSTNEVEFQVIRRISDNKLISTIRYHDDNASAYDILKTIPKDRKFLMSTKRDRTTAKDFGLVEKDGRYFNEKDGSEWVPHPMYDYGSGPENGFYKLPLGSFKELITYMEEKQEDWDQSLPAAVMILEKYPQELKKYLLKKIKDGIEHFYREFLIFAFKLDDLGSKTTDEKELKDWEYIGLHIGAFDNIAYEASLTWTSPENGGRKSGIPMKNKKYAPIVGINGQVVFEDGGTWSIICYNYEKTSDNTTSAYMRFLNNLIAPPILFKGTEFELYEGSKLVARGIIDNVTSDIDVLDIFTY